MTHSTLWHQLVSQIHNNDEGFVDRDTDIVTCVEYELQHESDDLESYLIHWIARCPDHTRGRLMFRALKRACMLHSCYHWHEIMRVEGYPMMVGAAMSQNIQLLEHAMAHVDEIDLERFLEDVDIPEVQKWYDENFT